MSTLCASWDSLIPFSESVHFFGLMNSATKFSVVQGRGFRGTRRFAFWFCLAVGRWGFRVYGFV